MKNILIADDSFIARTSLSNILKNDYNLIFANNGREAYQLTIENNFDLVLLDLLMPEMTGQEALQLIKKEKPDLPVIILSADIQKTTKEECFNLGANDFLNKPPSKNELLNIIRKYIG
jgi:twitching motility two-component system response regulator PilH